MTAPNPRRQRENRKIIDQLLSSPENCWIVHYSCESFYDRKDGSSPRVTSIAVRNLASAQTESFSIHQIAERKRIEFREISEKYDELEKVMLKEFFDHLKKYQHMGYIHWNMRNSQFGFAAIEHRMRVLGGTPFVLESGRKFDLPRILVEIYGPKYASDPKLESLIKMNGIKPLNFLSGADEAAAFREKRFVEMHYSTLRKVDVIADLIYRAHDRTLKTNASWWQMHGGRLRTVYDWFIENKSIAFAITLAGLIIGAWQLLKG